MRLTTSCMPGYRREGPQRTLIVVPHSIVYQWEKELETKTKGIFESIYIYHGHGLPALYNTGGE